MVYTFETIVWASTAADVAAALVLLGWASRWKRQQAALGSTILGRLTRAGVITVVALVVFVAKLATLGRTGVNFFGLIHLIYLDIVVVIPLLGLALLGAGRVRRGAAALPEVAGRARLLAVGMCLLALVGVYASWIEPFRLQLETATVPLAPERLGSAALRVGVLADIQTTRVTEYERDALDRLMALSPDLILLPGDLFQGEPGQFERELPALRDLVARLSAPAGVYFVLGDTDQQERVARILAGTEVRLLVNEVVRTTARDRQITIGGIELNVESPAAQATIRQLETAAGTDDLRVLLTHRPDAALTMPPATRIDLVVAGHTHGGQVQLPIVGPLLTLSNVPRRVAAGGLHDLGDGRRVYVSRGVGVERGQAPRLRFLCPPEITLLQLGRAP
ncbi:MAG: metallophosphoesterase family protein [Chloroflexi bacterium]|nr:metallophosphoesterase family protein [Chloroflexota bacterium]